LLVNKFMNAADDPFLKTIKMTRFRNDVIDAPDFAVTTQSGRVAFDDRGNSIWEWQTSPGVFTRDISLTQLQELQGNELSVVEENSVLGTSSPGAWSRRIRSRGMFKDVELVMPERRREESQRGFDAFIRRLLPA